MKNEFRVIHFLIFIFFWSSKMKNKFCVVHFSIFIFSGKLKNELSFCSIFHLFVKIGKWKISRNSFFIFLKNKVSVYTCFQNHVIHAFRAIRGTCCHFVFRLISLVHKTECPFISYFLFLIVQSIFDNFILCFLRFSLFFLLNIHILFSWFRFILFFIPFSIFHLSIFRFSFSYFPFFFFLYSFIPFSFSVFIPFFFLLILFSFFLFYFLLYFFFFSPFF